MGTRGLSAIAAAAVLLIGGSAAAQTMTDVDGRAWTLLAPTAGTVHVLVFVGSDCPISNRYAPEVARIADTYSARGVRILLVYEDPAITADAVTTHRAAFYAKTPLPAVIDREHALARAVGATATPTAAIYRASGRAYRGRIDDLYVALGQARRAPTEHTLRIALDAVLAGRRPPVAETQAIGCYIGGHE